MRHFHEIKIDEKFFRLPHERKDKLNPPLEFPPAEQRLFVKVGKMKSNEKTNENIREFIQIKKLFAEKKLNEWISLLDFLQTGGSSNWK